MKYPLKIKLGCITNLSDARYAAAVGIDYIGFNFSPNTVGYIAPIKAKEIIDWTTGSLVVAEFGEQSAVEIMEIAELLHVDIVEIENAILPDELLQIEKPIIKKIDVSRYNENQLETELKSYNQVADAFLLYASQTLGAKQLTLISQLCHTYQIIWGFDLHPDNVQHVIDTIKPYGIQLIGGEEERPGVKDFDSLADILELIGTEED